MTSYRKLALEVGIHFVIMYGVMYTMVDSLGDVVLNVNNLYMTLMMVMPMVALMLVAMRHMFKNQRLNRILYATSLIAFVGAFFFIRNQTFVGDVQFINSMIPHHSGAILMCEKSKIKDAELKTLCDEIAAGQRQEINQMKAILDRLKSAQG